MAENPAEFVVATRRYRAALVALYLLFVIAVSPIAVSTRFGQAVDTLAMYSVGKFLDFPDLFHWVLGLFTSAPTMLAVAVLAAAAIFVQERPALLLRLAIVIVGANGTTQLLKANLSRPYLGVDYELPNSFPSGHVTLAASVVVALIAVAPPLLRRAVTVLGWAVVTMVGVGVMVLGWHRLSDVLAAILIVGAFALAALPAEWQPRRNHPPRWVPSIFATAVYVFSALGLGLIGLLFVGRADVKVGIMEIMAMAGSVVPGGLVAGLAVLATAGVAASVTLAVDFLSGQ